MSGDLVIQLAQEALRIVLLVSAPMLGLGLIVGLMVSVFQATTSIQAVQRIAQEIAVSKGGAYEDYKKSIGRA